MCEICRFEFGHAPWCPCRPEMKPDEQALRELAKQMVETNKMKRQEVITRNATSNFQRIAELEAENAKLSNRVGSLTLDNDLLRRGAADDALTIHTCGEIIDRIKKENGDFRAKNSDLEKEVSKLRALVERAADHIGCSCMGCEKVEKECKEALK